MKKCPHEKSENDICGRARAIDVYALTRAINLKTIKPLSHGGLASSQQAQHTGNDSESFQSPGVNRTDTTAAATKV